MSIRTVRLIAAFLCAGTFLFGAVLECQAEGLELLTNTDLVGKDYRIQKDASLEICQRICTEESACTGFTFNEKARWCFLKDGNYNPVVINGAVSGRKLANDAAGIDGLLNNVLGETVSPNDNAGLAVPFPAAFADDPLQIVTPFHFGMAIDQAKEKCEKSDVIERDNGDMNLYCASKDFILAGLAPVNFLDFESGPDAKKRLTRVMLLLAEDSEYFFPGNLRSKPISGFVSSAMPKEVIDRLDEAYGEGMPPKLSSLESLVAVEQASEKNDKCRLNADGDAKLLGECDGSFPVSFDAVKRATWTWREGLVELSIDCGVVTLPGRTGGTCSLTGGKMTMYLVFNLARDPKQGRAALAKMSEIGPEYWHKRATEKPEQDFMLELRAGSVLADLPDQNYTQFRGVGIGMPRDQFAANLGEGFSLENSRIIRASTKENCGAIGSNASQRIARLELRLCFFNADGMSLEKFAQSIVDAYEISELNQQMKNIFGRVSECYVGLSQKNEQIEICDYPEASIKDGWYHAGMPTHIGMTINPPATGSGPSFD